MIQYWKVFVFWFLYNSLNVAVGIFGRSCSRVCESVEKGNLIGLVELIRYPNHAEDL